MTTKYEFGNDPVKFKRHQALWNRDEVKRSLVGFSFIGWYPFYRMQIMEGKSVYYTADA
ncbi:MAG: hypothetical protein JRK26_18875 [Deltaproteobacteria bacterium]|nr:hypothetical protein [Deltaproteobacteria bacterium]MBW1960011.1 hypothetical protein [Deltaproteobacteria bacterium]MBW1995963.1 hypothetical protein [Deltaproteobacteria bacterium]